MIPHSLKKKEGDDVVVTTDAAKHERKGSAKRVIYHNHARRLFGIAAKAQKSRAASGFLFRQPIATSSIVNHQKSNIWCARGKTHTALLFSIFCYIFDEDFFLRWADKTIAGSTRQGPDKSSSNSCRDKYSGWTKRKKKGKKARTRRRERMRSQRRQTTPPPPPRQAVAAQSSGGRHAHGKARSITHTRRTAAGHKIEPCTTCSFFFPSQNDRPEEKRDSIYNGP